MDCNRHLLVFLGCLLSLEFCFGVFCVLGFEVSELGSVFVVFELGVSIFGNETNTETKLVAFEVNHR